MPIALPRLDELPASPRRDLVVSLHELYQQAGKPAARIISKDIVADRDLESVSHETINTTLRGKNVPSWEKLKSVVVVLCRKSVKPVDISRQLVEFNTLWNGAHSPQPAEVRPRTSSSPRFEIDLPAPRQDAERVAARLHGELPARSPWFTGRDETLDEIGHRLRRSPEVPLILYGPIGTGKTQVAAEYVRRHHDDYAITWWVQAGDAGQVRESLLRMARTLGLPDSGDTRQDTDRLTALLAAAGPCLLVFDGLVSGDTRTQIRPSGSHIIITTRNSGWAQESPNDGLPVPDLDDSETAQLLRKQDPHITAEQIAQLTAVTGRTPLGLAEAYRLHRELGISWTDLAGRLADPRHVVLTGPARTSRRTVETVQQVLAERFSTEPGLLPLLTLLLGFGPGPVWSWMLRRSPDGQPTAGVRHLPADQAGLRQGLRLLAVGGLAHRHADTDGEWVSIPAILRLLLRELLPASYGEANRRHVVEILLRADPARPDDRQTRAWHQAITPHLRPAGLLESRRPQAYQTVHHQIRFLFLAGDLESAEQLGRDALAALARQDTVAPDADVVLLIKRDLANALRASGRYREANQVTEEAIAQVGDNQEIALDLARSRGHDLRIAGRYRDAYDLDTITHERHRGVPLGDGDVRYQASRYNLSVSRRFLGRYAEAAQADRADLDRWRGGRDRRWARLANALAEDMYGLGRYEDLVDLLAPVLEAGPGRELHRARRLTGAAFRRLGHLLPAVEQLGAGYQACREQLGERCELTLAVCMSFGNALRERGQFDTALHYCGLAADGYAQVMGPDNPLVQVAQVNTAAVHLARGHTGLAAEILNPAYLTLVDRIGERHPFTVLASVDRAIAMSVIDPETAWSWPRRAYEQARDVFGADHLDTLLAAAGFAGRDEDDDLAPGLDQILSALRRRFGARHDLVARVAGGSSVVVDIELPSA